MSTPRIRVLVIDDSAFARKVIREVLSKDPDIEVIGIARDGLEGLEKIEELKPDVVTLDLLMPDLDGIGVLQALPKNVSPRIIVVSVSGSNTDLAISALQNGAVDLVTKPTSLPTDRLYEMSDDLIAKVKAAAIARPRSVLPFERTQETEKSVTGVTRKTRTRLVVIGTSTGGPQALTTLFSDFPAGLPFPLAVALHIPAGYTASLAARISKISHVSLVEAHDGMELIPGQAVIAPGGMHLSIRSEKERLFAIVSREPLDTHHHPSVDVLFESAAKHVGNGTLGIVLTGMGDDGLRGSKAIRDQGGLILAESEESCVVYGMPRSVIEAGLANGEAPIGQMSELVVSSACDGTAYEASADDSHRRGRPEFT